MFQNETPLLSRVLILKCSPESAEMNNGERLIGSNMKFLFFAIIFSTSSSWALLNKICKNKNYNNSVFQESENGKDISTRLKDSCDRIQELLKEYEDAPREKYRELEEEQKDALAEFGVIKNEYDIYIKKNPLN